MKEVSNVPVPPWSMVCADRLSSIDLFHCLLPAGFATLSLMGSPKVKNVAVSLTMPVSIFVGAGAIPAGLGIAGELGSFSVGFAILGGCFLAVSFLVGRLELPDKQ